MDETYSNDLSESDRKANNISRPIGSLSAKRELAEGLFESGHNCAQAVLCAFSEEVGLTDETCRKLASSFGGGMGRMRLVCGAFSAMLMVAGLLSGYTETGDYERKAAHYKLVQDLSKEFRSIHKTHCCNELLGGSADNSYKPTARSDEFYRIRPCKKIIGDCAEIIEKRWGL